VQFGDGALHAAARRGAEARLDDAENAGKLREAFRRDHQRRVQKCDYVNNGGSLPPGIGDAVMQADDSRLR